MDNFANHMDKIIKHLSHYPRRLKMVPAVSDVGRLLNKDEWVKHPFATCNFSFVLKGVGRYRFNGENLVIEGPCVLLQWPNGPMDYGPDNTWDEIYFMYPGNDAETLEKAGVFNIQQPVWRIPDILTLKPLFKELMTLIELPPDPGRADRIDFVCWQIIAESIIAKNQDRSLSESEKKIRQLIKQFQAAPCKHYDFNKIAYENGMSLPTLRRLWCKYMNVPPARYLADLKIDIACQLLINSSMTISEIANELNFNDPLYFSRFFRQKTGLSATEYREINLVS